MFFYNPIKTKKSGAPAYVLEAHILKEETKLNSFINQKNINMNRFTLLLLVLMVSQITAWSQVGIPDQNVFVKHSITGTVSEIQAYSNGLIFLGNDGTDDVIVYSSDSEAWNTAESLVAGSASKISSWAGSQMSFYYGNNASETEGLDMRLLNNGTSSIFWQGGHASYGTEARTNVIRHDYGGAIGMRYYYLGRTTDAMPPRGYDAIVYESDGTDLGTIEVTHNVGFGKTIKMTNQTNDGMLEGCVFNGKLHILAGMESAMGAYSTVFAVNYNGSGSDVSLLAQSANESYSWVNMMATSSYIYVQSDAGGVEPGSMIAIATDGTYAAVNNGGAMVFKVSKPVQYGDRIIAIKDVYNTPNSKIAIIDGPTDVKLINVNPENETDAISNLVVSGNLLYFVATPTGGNPKIYSLNLDEAAPTANAIADVNNLADMVALGDGYLAYTFDKYGSGNYSTHITKGVEYVIYELYYGSSFALLAPVSVDLLSVGDDLYQIEYTGTTTNIWKHTLDASQFPTANIQFTIKDNVTAAVITGAELKISNGVYSYTGTSDASGHVTFMNIEGGTYYDYSLKANGYLNVDLSRQWISAAPDNTKELLMEEDGATDIGDVESNAISIYPNPVDNVINLVSEASITSFELYSLVGNKVMQVLKPNISTIDVSNISAGVYVVIVVDSNGNRETMKITKH